MKTLKTMCARDCYDSCFILADVDDNGVLVSVKGDPDNPVTQGFVCPRGKMDNNRVYKNRVLFPQIRVGDKPGKLFQRTGWDETLDTISNKLKEIIKTHGRESVLLLDYSGNTGLLSEVYPHRLWNALGASRTDGAMCSKAGRTALSLHYGNYYGLQPEELCSRDLVVFWGFNAPVSASHLWAQALKARKPGAPIIVVDPRKCEAAKNADLHFQPKPGSDVALVMGICRILIEKNWLAHEFIEKYTLGFDILEKEIMSWSPQRVQIETGLNWHEVETLAEFYGKSKLSATLMGIGLQKSFNGADLVRAVSFIPALRGLHRGFFYSNSDGFLIDYNFIAGDSLANIQAKTVSQVALSELIRDGVFKFIFIYGINPALTLPNQSAFCRGLVGKSGKEPFVVVHDTHWTNTADYADVVLPAQTFFEKQDIVVTWVHRYIRLSPRVIEPLGESRDEIWLMQELARRLNIHDEWVLANPWQELEKAFNDALANGNFQDLLNGKDLMLKLKAPNCYETPSGKLEFSSSRAVQMGIHPIPRHSSIKHEADEFILLNSAVRNYTSTQFTESYGPIPAVVTINHADAARLNINENDRVKLINNQGCVSVNVEISHAVPQNVLWMPRLSITLDGKPMNELTPSLTQPIGGGPTFNSTLVKIIR
ncbi:MAG: molybdopterin-dependent oxidoreductase [Acidobacteria bacterium]|jgi:anaerobic selenocysteine-containing dehydrogenase|nr:molybdopterin-dependent oxidoreductase [Acidobacteriota bacterium]